MPKRTRHRQLARVAARRQAERRQRQRRRQVGTIVVALVVALVGGSGVLIWALGGDEGTTAASGPTGPTVSPSPSPSVEGEPGTKTGMLSPQPGPEEVACGGEVPPGARRPKPQFNAPADVVKAGRTYTATFETSCGEIVIELLADQAPETVNSFVFLAQQGFFDATRIHRLDTSIDVIQGGDPTGTGTAGPGYAIPDELTGNEHYPPGTLAMANSGPDTGGSQFFLIAGPNGRNLDQNPAYTIFGRIVSGLPVAQRILALPIQDPTAGITGQQPKQAVYLETVTISSEPAQG